MTFDPSTDTLVTLAQIQTITGKLQSMISTKASSEDVTPEIAHLHRDVSHVAFSLETNGTIDAEDFDCISIDTIDNADAVNLISGKYASGYVYI